jgi:hypothetical protein
MYIVLNAAVWGAGAVPASALQQDNTQRPVRFFTEVPLHSDKKLQVKEKLFFSGLMQRSPLTLGAFN